MGKSLIVDLNGTFGYLLRGLLQGQGHDAALAETVEQVSSYLRLHYYEAAFVGYVPDALLERMAIVENLRMVQIGTSIGLSDFCDEVLERPLRLSRLSELAGQTLVPSQRREHRRVRVSLPAELNLAGHQLWSGQVTDLALGGMRLELDVDPADIELTIGQIAEAKLGFSGDTIGLPTRVIYSQQTDSGLCVGLGFEDLGKPIAVELKEYLLCA